MCSRRGKNRTDAMKDSTVSQVISPIKLPLIAFGIHY